MKLYYAHYPALENYFVNWVKSRRNHPLEKWLIVCSSSLIAQRLQAQLARQIGALANVHFSTLSGLITRLDQEAPGEILPLLPQDHLRDFLIKQLLLSPQLNRYPISRGLVQSVKSALRDLSDSLADPDILEEHWCSMPDSILQEDNGRFLWLIQLYRQYKKQEQSVPGLRSYQQAFERALEQAEHSPYLHSFSQIIVYGFYDMPGRQLELFNRLKNSGPLTVFTPYEKHPAYRFAQKFFETNFLPTAQAEQVSAVTPTAIGKSAAYLFNATDSAPASNVHMCSVPDGAGGIFYAAKEMLRLHEQEGFAWKDMAVVARTLPPHQDEIRRCFRENYIPLNASFTYPLAHYTLGNFCLTLFSLLQQGFARPQVLALFAAPYFKHSQKYRWLQAVRKYAVNRDVSQWKDLLADTSGPEKEALQWVEQTAHQLELLNQPQSWKEGVQKALAFLEDWTDTDAFQGKDAEIYQAVQEALSKMAVYDAIRPQCKPGELVQEITEAISALTFHEAETVEDGVAVLDSVRARGLCFKVIFITGVSEGEFPPVIGEDPILRDYYRLILRDTLGYWINPSLDRLDEERLLFYTLVTAAREHLYVLIPRRTAEGKEAMPSVYAAELARACSTSTEPAHMTALSSHLAQRLAHFPTDLLTPKELSYQFILHPHTAAQHYQQAGLLSEDKMQSLQAAEALSARGPLGPFDGILQSGEPIFARQNSKGFSPSSLQELATCPLKYFFHKGLRLEEPEEPLSRQELAANEQGTSSHAVLREFYTTLLNKNLTHQLFTAGIAQYLTQSFEKFYPAASYRVYGIYPVVWELITENLRRTLTEFASEDMAHLENFTPTFFEQEITTVPSNELPFKLHGFIDRIDVDEPHKLARIIDYKSNRKGTKHLEKDFFTLLIFQPFLYMWMARQEKNLAPYALQGACLLTLANFYEQTLPVAAFEQIRPAACHFLRQLVELVKQGKFFISPGEACKYCPYAMLCRKDAFRPLLRARKSALATSLQEMRHDPS